MKKVRPDQESIPSRFRSSNSEEEAKINSAIRSCLAGSDGNSYILEHSDNLHANCPLNADNLKFDINMWDGKYEVTFLYQSSQENSIMLQLYKFESLQ